MTEWLCGRTRHSDGGGCARLKLREHPLCQACLQVGRIEPATVVDHRTPIKRGGDPFPHLDHLASLCESCHNAKTRAEQMGEDWLRKGCDIFGYPLDAASEDVFK